MRLSDTNEAIRTIRTNERIRTSLLAHVSAVRREEMEALAVGTDDISQVRFMQGRISILTELEKLLGK